MATGLRLQSLAKDSEHLLLHIRSDYGAVLASLLCELTGEKARATPKIKDPVAGFHVPVCKTVRAISEAPETGIEMCGIFCRKNVMVRSGGGHNYDIGKREGY